MVFFNIACKENKITEKRTSIETESNILRRFIGLDTLSTKWVKKKSFTQDRLQRVDFANIDSTNKIKGNNYSFKTCWYQFGLLIMEGDAYVINYYDKSENRSINKMIGYLYCFVPDDINEKGWSYHYSTSKDEKLRGCICKYQADSILNSWGINRPNYIFYNYDK